MLRAMVVALRTLHIQIAELTTGQLSTHACMATGARAIMLNKPERYGRPRLLKINSTPVGMLNSLPGDGDRVFSGDLYVLRRAFRTYRKSMA